MVVRSIRSRSVMRRCTGLVAQAPSKSIPSCRPHSGRSSAAIRSITAIILLSFLLGAAGYRRAQWLPRWADYDHDCKSTRTEVLEAQADGPVRYNKNGCSIVSGKWIDPYSRTVYGKASDLDIDHIVPLEMANRSGGAAWSTDKKRHFANWEPGLLAVSASLNRQKGAKGPAEWLPPAMPRCEYVAEYVRVKEAWELTLTAAERRLWKDCQ